MNTLIPIEYFALFYYNVLLLFVLIVFSQSLNNEIQNLENLKKKNGLGNIILLFTILYIGTRPIDFIFVDMIAYATDFQNYASGGVISIDKDVLFEEFIMFCSKIMTVDLFFMVCAIIYIVPLYVASKKLFKEYWFYAFFILVISFSFWAYGTNGIRNGIATSIFILGIAHNKKAMTFALVILSIFIHKSLMLPAVAFVISFYYNNPKMYLKFWFLTIPLSLALGGFWESFFLGLGFGEDQRLVGYLSADDSALDQIVELKVGFRWDFLLYSATGVYAGWYFIVKQQFEDKFYNQLYSMYLIANGFWILVIRANFSNRFAYLSWFMLGLVIIYPLLKKQFFVEQHKVVGKIMLLYFVFTYVLNVFLA